MDEILKKNIYEELRLDRLPEAEREEAMLKISNIILKSILVRALRELDEEQQTEMERIVQENPNDPQPLFSFLNSEIEDFEAIFQDEVAAVKRDILSTIPDSGSES